MTPPTGVAIMKSIWNRVRAKKEKKMRLKTYFATGVDAAMMLARQELGPDAMLVHSKRTVGDAKSLGSYEVVFALEDSVTVSPEGTVSVADTPHAVADVEVRTEIAGLRGVMEQTLRLVRRSESILRSKDPLDDDGADLDGVLADGGFSSELRARIQRELGPGPGSIRQRAMLWFQRQFRTNSQLGRPGFARKTIALIGPAGCGKTTTLVKLAARYGVAGRRPAQILSLDAERVGAAECLRLNAGVLGIGFQLLDTIHALSQALAEHAHKDLILIDTPGLSVASIHDCAAIGAFLASRKEIDTHVVLPADASSATLSGSLNRYLAFEPAKVIFTRLDETRLLGPMVEAAIALRVPLSFLSGGQRVPEDLESADDADILNKVLPLWLDEGADHDRTRKAAA